MTWWRLFIFFVAVAGPGAGGAEVRSCGMSPDVTVVSADRALAAHACEVPKQAAPRLSACGLAQEAAVQVTISRTTEALPMHCFGAFDCTNNEITVLAPDLLRSATGKDPLHDVLAPEIAFDSLLVHEYAHAALTQTLDGRDIGVAGQEYVAYTMQIGSLDPDQRSLFLQDIKSPGEPKVDAFNEMVLNFSRRTFAAWTWWHFSAPGNGCAFVADLIEGTISLDVPDF